MFIVVVVVFFLASHNDQCHRKGRNSIQSLYCYLRTLYLLYFLTQCVFDPNRKSLQDVLCVGGVELCHKLLSISFVSVLGIGQVFDFALITAQAFTCIQTRHSLREGGK